MKAWLAWILGLTAWIAVTFTIYVGCAALWSTEGSCDRPVNCEPVTGPGPGNGR